MAHVAIPVGLTAGFITLIEKSLEVYRAISAARNFGSSAAQAVMMLRFEAYRYAIWVQANGSMSAIPGQQQSDGRAPIPFDAVRAPPGVSMRAALYDAVTQIFEILRGVDQLLSKYDRAFESSDQDEATVLNGLSLSLAGIMNQPNEAAQAANQYQSLKHSFQSKTSFLRRVKYGIQTWNDADKDTLKELIANFKYWNDGLHELVPLQKRNLLESRLSSEVVGPADSPDYLGKIETAADASAYPSLSRSARLKRHNLEVRNVGSGLKKLYSDVEITGKLARSRRFITSYSSSEREPTSAFIPPKRVIVEWYYYDEKWTQPQITLADERVEQLAHDFSMEDKPQSLRVLDCIGYICHPEKADRALLYAVPSLLPSTTPLNQPLSLLQLLSPNPGAGEPRQQPSLPDRFHLATLLATSFLELHNVAWVHKYFNSHNVLFFTNPEHKISYTEPYITGFDFSRQDKAGQISLTMRKSPLDLYRHPDLRQVTPDSKTLRTYTRKHDVYSLGLVLFEIGMWRRLEDFSKPNMGAEDFRRRILGYLEGDMAFRMGGTYQHVIAKCISGECLDGGLSTAISLDLGADDETEENGGASLTDCEATATESASQLNSFYENVVSELQRCQCGAS